MDTMTQPQNIESIEKATGRKWSEWLEWLEERGAKDLSHTEIARLVHKELEGKVDSFGWWAQGVTVAYEQQTGRRVPGQKSDGTFEISVSRTVKGSREGIFQRLSEQLESEFEFGEVNINQTRTSVTPVRSYWRCELDNGTKVVWALEEKGEAKCLLVVTHTNLTSSESAESWRDFWSRYLEKTMSR